MLESGSTPWGGNRNLAQNKKNNWNEKGARLGLIEDWSSFLFLDRKTDSLRHKDKKDIFSAGFFLDKKSDDLRHKDKKDIFCFLCFYFWSLLLSCFYLCVFTFGLFVFSSFIMACREVYALFFLTPWHGPFLSNKICFFFLSVYVYMSFRCYRVAITLIWCDFYVVKGECLRCKRSAKRYVFGVGCGGL